MMRHWRSLRLGAILALAATLPMTGVQAARYVADLNAYGEIKEFVYGDEPSPPTTENFGFSKYDDGVDLVSVSDSGSVHALWTGSGSASASAGTLRVGLASAIGENDPNRWVSSLSAYASAGMADEMRVAGASDLAFVDYSFRVDGALIGPGAYGVIGGLDRSVWNNSVQELSFFGSAEEALVDQNFTLRVRVVEGLAQFTAYLYASIYYQPPESDYKTVLPDYLTATIDFTNTARLTALTGRNAAGQQVALTSAIGSGGDDYLALVGPAGVPEPATWATMLLGFGLIGGAIRRARPARPAAS